MIARCTLTSFRCVTINDVLKIMKIKTSLGHSDERSPTSTRRDKEMRSILHDFKEENKDEIEAVFKSSASIAEGENDQLVKSSDFCQLLMDVFSRSSQYRFFRFDKGPETDFLVSAEENQPYVELSLSEYFFQVLGIEKDMYEGRVEKVLIDSRIFWNLLYYMIETDTLGFKYQKDPGESLEDTRQSLIKTLKEYEDKYFEAKDPSLRLSLKRTIATLQNQIDKFDRPDSPAKLRDQEVVWRRALSEVFHFYSKQQKIARKDQTFDSYKHELNNMNIGEWLRFCKDFDLNPQHWPRKGLTEEEKLARSKLCKEVSSVTLTNLYKLEASGSTGISYESFEVGFGLPRKFFVRFATNFPQFSVRKKSRF